MNKLALLSINEAATQAGRIIGHFARQLKDKERIRYLENAKTLYPLAYDSRPCVHFVNFRGDEIHTAKAIWGEPDFYHRIWDSRAKQEIAPQDIVIFAKGNENEPTSKFTYDDSNQADDPAAKERKTKS